MIIRSALAYNSTELKAALGYSTEPPALDKRLKRQEHDWLNGGHHPSLAVWAEEPARAASKQVKYKTVKN